MAPKPGFCALNRLLPDLRPLVTLRTDGRNDPLLLNHNWRILPCIQREAVTMTGISEEIQPKDHSFCVLGWEVRRGYQ